MSEANFNFLTIYTDASLCSRTKTGGWACWAKYKGATIEASGPFEEPLDSSMEAELKALYNGLWVALDRFKPDRTDVIVMVTDCKQAMEVITGVVEPTKRGRRKQPKVWTTFDDLNALIPDRGRFHVKKVKAHSNHDGARSFINNKVDEAAKIEMRKKRQELLSRIEISTVSVDKQGAVTQVNISQQEDFDVPF